MRSHHLVTLLSALALGSSALAQVANNECASAIGVNSGVNGPYSNVGATTSVPAWPCASGANDVWFSCIALQNGTMSVDLCTLATWDTALQVFSGTCAALTSLGCNDDSCTTQSQLTNIAVTAGTTYFIRVGGYAGATGSFSLNVTGPMAASANAASAFGYGAGCYDNSRSFYERFYDSSFLDLANSSFTLVNLGTNYAMIPSTATYVPPSASAQVLQCLPDNDEGETTVSLLLPMPYPGGTTSSLVVCSNGYVSAGPGNPVNFIPSASQWNSSLAARWGGWTDYDGIPAASGRIKFEQVANMVYVSWDGVYHWNRTTPNFFQLQFDNISGNVNFVWGAMSTIGPAHLVGFGAAGGSRDRGSLDVSALVPTGFQTGINDDLPLRLTGGRPVTNTAISMVTDQIPATATLALGILSFTQYDPGLDLAAFGMAGCRQFVGFDAVSLLLPSGGAATQSLSIPNNAGLAGLVFVSQSLAFVPAVNPLGAIASNGVRLTIGTF